MTTSSTPVPGPRRAVVFDLDGVIVESEHLWEEMWRRYAERFSWNDTTDGQLRLFEQVLARRAGALALAQT